MVMVHRMLLSRLSLVTPLLSVCLSVYVCFSRQYRTRNLALAGEVVRQNQEGRIQLPRRVLVRHQPRGEGHDRQDAQRRPEETVDSRPGLGAPLPQGNKQFNPTPVSFSAGVDLILGSRSSNGGVFFSVSLYGSRMWAFVDSSRWCLKSYVMSKHGIYCSQERKHLGCSNPRLILYGVTKNQTLGICGCMLCYLNR